MIKITRTSTIEALQSAIDLMGPDYTYVTPGGEDAAVDVMCSYVDQAKNAPSCIVGHVLYAHGVTLSELVQYEGESAHKTATAFGASEQVGDMLNRVQELQDTGVPWAEAVKGAYIHICAEH